MQAATDQLDQTQVRTQRSDSQQGFRKRNQTKKVLGSYFRQKLRENMNKHKVENAISHQRSKLEYEILQENAMHATSKEILRMFDYL